MSLSPIGPLSIPQNSLFDELASATKNSSSTSTSIVPAAGSTTVSVNSSEDSSSTAPSDTLANDLATLLKSLGSGDVNSAKAALKKVESDLQAQNSASPSSTASTSSTSSTSSSSQSSNPLTNLLNQLSSALNSGDTNSALQDLTNFLVTMGQGTGAAVNVTA